MGEAILDHMRRPATIMLCALGAGCSFSHGVSVTRDGDVDGMSDPDGDSMGSNECVLGKWNAPQPITELNSGGLDARPRLSPDELNVVFYSDRLGDRDIFTASRTAIDQPFSMPAILPVVNTTAYDRDPAMTSDGKELFFASDRFGALDIFTATRSSTSADFSGPQLIGALNTNGNDYFLSLSHDGLTIYYSSNRSGGTGTMDIWYSTRASLGAAFGAPQLLTGVSSATYNDHSTAISADGREIYVSQTTTGGEIDIFVATRADTSSQFDTPVRVAELSFTGEDHPGWLSPDGLRFYYSNQAVGNSQIFMATRTCE